MSLKSKIIYGVALVPLLGWIIATIIEDNHASAAHAELSAARTVARHESVLKFVKENQLVTDWCKGLSHRSRKRLFFDPLGGGLAG